MKILILVPLLSILFTGCTTRTKVDLECKDGFIHYTYERKNVTLNMIEEGSSGIAFIESTKKPIKCDEGR